MPIRTKGDTPTKGAALGVFIYPRGLCASLG